MNKNYLSKLKINKESVVFIKFRSLERQLILFSDDIMAILPDDYTHLPVLKDESIEHWVWIDDPQERVLLESSYNDIAFIVIYMLPILSSIHTTGEWINLKSIITNQIVDFGSNLDRLVGTNEK